MPPNHPSDLSPAERRREVPSILARGVVRWRRRARSAADVMRIASPTPLASSVDRIAIERMRPVSGGPAQGAYAGPQ